MKVTTLIAIAMSAARLVAGVESTPASKDSAPAVLRTGNKVALLSPTFSFNLDITDGLHAELWENKLTGRKLVMGHGSEVGFDIGLPGQPLTTPQLIVTKAPSEGRTAGGEAVFELTAREPMAVVTVTYRWDAKRQVLHKQVVIRNTGTSVWNRLLDVRLGSYSTDAAPFRDPDWPVPVRKTAWMCTEPVMWADPAGRERGYPAYPENQFFAGLAHPSGFALLQDQQLRMLQHPGLMLAPAKEFICMEAVYGVAASGEARPAFRAYLGTRMRRVLRGHDRPYAILATCGAQAGTDDTYNFTAISEATSLDHISHMAQAQRTAGLHWDYYDIEFWHDPAGDLKAPDAKRFPNGFDPVLSELKKLGTTPGLWISSGSTDSKMFQGAIDRWTIGSNPALQACGTDGDGKGRLCRATEPANRMYIDGLIHQIRTNKIGMIKLDNNGIGEEGIYPWCNNPKHGHLPGDWSIEANHNAQLELLTALDRESPELFIILYWGHRSPWWLLHGDTLFDVGMRIEMASLAATPALYARSSNVRLMDQTRRLVKDLPALGWDSLGVSLSRWCWNNRLGAECWQESVLMDMCRGTLLTHIWSDPDCFPAADRPQMAEFIALLKARPDCFVRPRFIGDARKDDVWGYSCSDGSRAMIALDNGSWHDQVVPLEFNAAWGLPDNGQWDVYCWYPNHVKFTTGDGKPFGGKASIVLRPFSQVLLEVVPAGQKPALARSWDRLPMPNAFTEASSDVAVTATVVDQTKPLDWTIRGEIPPCKTAGWLAVTAEFRRDGQPFLSLENRPATMTGSLAGQPAVFQPVLDNPLYPAPWQTFRLRVAASESARPFELAITVGLPKNVALAFAGHFVPGVTNGDPIKVP